MRVKLCYLDQGKEDGDDIVAAPLKVDQKRAKERRDRTQDKTMGPQVGVLGKMIYQLSEEGSKMPLGFLIVQCFFFLL